MSDVPPPYLWMITCGLFLFTYMFQQYEHPALYRLFVLMSFELGSVVFWLRLSVKQRMSPKIVNYDATLSSIINSLIT